MLRGPAPLVALLVACSPLALADAEAGRVLALQGDGKGSVPCVTCHGANGEGNPVGGFAMLAGLDAGYLARQLTDIKRGTRISPVMAPLLATLDEQQFVDVAQWYASLEPPAPAALPEVDDALLAEGRALVEDGAWDSYIVPCTSCHGPGLRGVGSAFPALAGQHASYLTQQLQAWRDGSRRNDPDQLMLAIAARMSPRQIEAVSEYIARLAPSGE